MGHLYKTGEPSLWLVGHMGSFGPKLVAFNVTSMITNLPSHLKTHAANKLNELSL